MIFKKESYYMIAPSGTSDDTVLIQSALSRLCPGDTLLLNGDFVFRSTLYLPSHIHWILNGSLSLADDAILDNVCVCGSPHGHRKPVAITAQKGGATNIRMTGGTYYSNNYRMLPIGMRFLYFARVSGCRFEDMNIQGHPNQAFTLRPLCNDNEHRNLDYFLTHPRADNTTCEENFGFSSMTCEEPFFYKAV